MRMTSIRNREYNKKKIDNFPVFLVKIKDISFYG
jgi:hypothetical protein